MVTIRIKNQSIRIKNQSVRITGQEAKSGKHLKKMLAFILGKDGIDALNAMTEEFQCSICLRSMINPMLCKKCKKFTGCKECCRQLPNQNCALCRGKEGYIEVKGFEKSGPALRNYDKSQE